MNKRIRTWLHVIILCLGVVLPSLTPLAQVQAAEFNDVITEMSLKNSSGGDLTQGIDIWQDFRVYAKFVLPDNQVHQGDTTTITLPPEYAFANSSAIELKDESGNLVANGFLDSANKTITLTYTNYVEQKSGVRGEFFFYARVDHDVVSQEGDLNAGFTIGGRTLVPGTVHYNGPPKQYDSKIEKSSFQYKDDEKNVIRYNITVNRNMANYSDVTIKDAFSSPNITFLPDTFRIYKVDWRWNNGDWKWSNAQDMTETFKKQMTVNPGGDGFTLPLGDTNGFGYMIEYRAKANYDLVDGEKITNVAKMNYNGGLTEQSTSTRTYQIAGGVAEGYVFSIKIHKVNEAGENLQGAEFEVVRDSTGAVVGKLTTDADGNASVGELLRDNYTIREVKAPEGYDKSTEEIKIGSQDFGTDKSVSRDIVNKKTTTEKAITFSKVNLGGTEIAGAQIKIYKGDKAEGQAVESWTSEAGKSKELNLAPGTYTFHEEAAPTGYLKVTDITFQVKTDGTVEVTNVGEKDSKGEDNKVVTNGSTVTVTDKDDDLPRKITFSKLSLGGEEIAGAQIKIYKGDKAEGQAVESWTSEAGKSKDLNLAPGTYTFHEEAAPTGYLKVTDITFQVKHDGTVEVTNVGEKDSKGEENKIVTDGSKVTVTDKDDDLPRKITFSKVNLGGTEIAGAQIKIFKGDKAEGQAVESWTSEAGKSKELNLAPGTYTFHEEAAPTGYLKVTDITFQVKTDGTVEVTNVGEKDSKGEDNKVVIDGSKVTVTDKDDDLPRKITFSKVSLGGEEIAGAQIKIYKGEKAEGDAVENWTSEAGKSKELNLAPGTYTFHEEAAPTGYLKVTDITFQVKHDGTVEVTNVGEKDSKGEENKVVTNGSTVTVTDKDDDLPRKITFSKVSLGGEEIAGAQIKIYKGEKAEGDAVENWTSEAGKSKELNLAPGTYTFHEEAAPTGYLKVTDITFQVKYDGTVEVINVGEKDSKGEDNKVVTDGSKVTVTDKDDDLPRKVTFSKINQYGTEIGSAQIQIFRGNEATGNLVAEWTSEVNKSHDLELAPGVYTFHEATAPAGYLAVKDITFQVNFDGTITILNANGNTVEYKDGKLVVTDQSIPTIPSVPNQPNKPNKPNKPDKPGNKDPKDPGNGKPKDPDKKNPKDPGKTNPKDSEKPQEKDKTKKTLPLTGTELSFTLLALGLTMIVGWGVYYGTRFKN
ncbi:cell wall anchor [Streptococcus gordonii]|uniref:SpaA isopeptide-forming pilin-related protein n=1 Tax=Streptococcus gordonii TaxID=1302 RepID=UPI000E51D5CC|nr:SpaA isopeptide-forming pilin-related protein [Streptococcus gordonii]RHE62713.1 cell wall anchor [Streptococcus gordonii]